MIGLTLRKDRIGEHYCYAIFLAFETNVYLFWLANMGMERGKLYTLRIRKALSLTIDLENLHPILREILESPDIWKTNNRIRCQYGCN